MESHEATAGNTGGEAAGSTAEPECTCGVGTMFYSHLHVLWCPFATAGIKPPPTAAQLLAMLGLQSERYQSDGEYRLAVDNVLARTLSAA